MRNRTIAAALAALVAAGPSVLAAGVSPSEGFAFSTYRQETDGVIVIVDTYPASIHDRDAFFPLHVAVGLQGHRDNVTITDESFTLVDRQGHAYPMATYPQIQSDYGKATFDRALVRSRPLVVGSQFAVSDEVPANFFPSVGLLNDTIHLANYTWFHDVIYFPHPEAGLGGVLELRVTGKGIQQPVVVGFKVPLKMREEPDEG